MSGNVDHQQEPTNLPEPNSGDNQNPKTVSQDLNEWLVSQSSVADTPTLPTLSVGTQAARTTEDSPLPPTYKVSPADSYNLSSYIMTPLDEPEPEPERPSGWQTAWAVIREVGETIILTLVIFFLIQLVIRNFRVVGTSMINNLHDGQYLIIDKLTYSPLVTEILGMGGPQRGDVIVFKPPRNPEDDYVKRIIGLAGEKVQVINGQVFINDEPLPEPFQPTPGSYTMPAPITVPEGQVFVLGDNRNNSNDSHNWGPLPIENIVGRAWLSYWPPDQWGVIPRDEPTEQATLQHFLQQLIPHANAKSE